MPFTFAHPAIVLPLKHLPKAGLFWFDVPLGILLSYLYLLLIKDRV